VVDHVEAFEIEPSYDHEDPFGQGPRVLWGRIAALAGLVVFAFLIGHLTGGGGSSSATVTSLQSQLNAANSHISSLEASLANNGAGATSPSVAPSVGASTLPSVAPSVVPSISTTVGPTGASYTVKSGDSLTTIEEAFYHTFSQALTQLLETANSLTAAVIHPGQKLVIPPASEATTVPVTSPSPVVSVVPSPHVSSTPKK
jgi:LysM repeat protein